MVCQSRLSKPTMDGQRIQAVPARTALPCPQPNHPQTKQRSVYLLHTVSPDGVGVSYSARPSTPLGILSSNGISHFAFRHPEGLDGDLHDSKQQSIGTRVCSGGNSCSQRDWSVPQRHCLLSSLGPSTEVPATAWPKAPGACSATNTYGRMPGHAARHSSVHTWGAGDLVAVPFPQDCGGESPPPPSPPDVRRRPVA